MSAHGAAVKLILCGTNAAGDVEGLARLRRVGDAVVLLDVDGWLVKKRRWLPDCPQRLPRQAREEHVPRVLHLTDFGERGGVADDLPGERSRRAASLDEALALAQADTCTGSTLSRAHAPMTHTGSTSSAAAVRHLAAIAPALRQGQAFSITRLTILKALCRDPRDAARFAMHLATVAHREIERGPRPCDIDRDAWKRYSALAAEAMKAIREPPARASTQSISHLQDILSRVESVQDTVVHVPFGEARNITNRPLLIIEYALRILVSPHDAAQLSYRIARAFAERYDPEHGTGLIPASAPFIEEIAEFWSRHLLRRPPDASSAPTSRKPRKAVARSSPRSAPRPAPSPVATAYPAIARWVDECGWIEIGTPKGARRSSGRSTSGA